MRHGLVSRLGIQQFSCTHWVEKSFFLLVLSVPPLNVTRQLLFPAGAGATDICFCLATSYSAMSSPIFLLSKVNKPLGVLCFCFGVFLWEYKVSELKHRFNFKLQ